VHHGVERKLLEGLEVVCRLSVNYRKFSIMVELVS
jgi:hypothetical protein